MGLQARARVVGLGLADVATLAATTTIAIDNRLSTTIACSIVGGPASSLRKRV